MSGSSFNYLCDHPDAGSGAYEEMASCVEVRWPAAAAALRGVAKAKRAGEDEHERLAGLMKAIEWYVSGDWGAEDVTAALVALGLDARWPR